MYTQCPECKKPHALTVEDLRRTHGMLKCKTCTIMFDALELLSIGSIDNVENTLLPSPNNTHAFDNNFWPQKNHLIIGGVFLFFLLLFQVYFFESYNMTQNPTLRPWLKKGCTVIPGCKFPHYKNLNELTILDGHFEPAEDYYIFKTTIINQSLFSQKLPSIRLILIDFTGGPFAERIFLPTEYSKEPKILLKSETSKKITLTIATPANKVGGYNFELI